MLTDRGVLAALAIGTVAGALSRANPSGNALADQLLAAGFAATLVLAGAAVARHAVVGACAGGLLAQVLLRIPDVGFHGLSALVAAVVTVPLLVAAYLGTSARTRSRLHKGAVIASAGLGVILVGYGIAAAKAHSQLEHGLEQLDRGIAAGRQGDDQAAAANLESAAESFASADRTLGAPWAVPADVVPVVGHNSVAVRQLTSDAAALARRGGQAARHANVDSLTLRHGQLDVQQLRRMASPLDRLSRAMNDSANTIRRLDSPWLVSPVSDKLDSAFHKIAGSHDDTRLLRDATRVLPDILGADRPSRWFVAFVTPVEARGRTGFLGNYAELTVSNGRLEMSRFGRTTELDTQGLPAPERTLHAPDDYQNRWGRFAPAASWRNVTMSPDFPSVGQVITGLYPQSGGQPVDGVISLDPYALAALLQLTGPIEVPELSEPLTAENAASFLLNEQYIQFPDRDERVDVLSITAQQTFERLTSSELPSPRQLADVLDETSDDGHIQLFSIHPDQQSLFRRIGLDGSLPPVRGDALAVVNNNAAGNKADLFLSRQLDYRARWSPGTGDISATLTVTLTNSAPTEGLPDYVIGSALGNQLPKGTNRTYLSIYSPLELDQMTVDGAPTPVESQRERDRWAYSVILDVPGGGGQRTVTLELRGTLTIRGDYRLDVAAQPQVIPDQLNLSVDALSSNGAGSSLERSDTLSTAVSSYHLETLHSS